MILNMISGNGGTPVTGTPTIYRKTTYVSTTRTSATEISFSGLDVGADETLVGFLLAHQGTVGTASTDLNTAHVYQNGSSWDIYAPMTYDGGLIITQLAANQTSFVPSGSTGGTLTTTTGWTFLEGTYRVYPVVAKVE